MNAAPARWALFGGAKRLGRPPLVGYRFAIRFERRLCEEDDRHIIVLRKAEVKSVEARAGRNLTGPPAPFLLGGGR
jgi:hypothetical protein